MLEQVKGGIKSMPDFVLIYGVDGVGKSTFAAGAPGAVFLGPEDGTSNIDVRRFPTAYDMKDILSAVKELREEKHDYKTLVIDTLDWTEQLVWKHVCDTYEKPVKNIEEIPYGKGYVAANKVWFDLVLGLKKLREEKQMNVILIAHAHIKAFQDPQANAAYDRYILKMRDISAAIVREAVDVVLFANYVTHTIEKQGKSKAYGDGKRVMYTERRPAFDAKNRFGLPFELPLSWEEYQTAKVIGSPESKEKIEANVVELLQGVTNDDLKKRVTEAVTKAKGDVKQLVLIQNMLRARLTTQQEAR